MFRKILYLDRKKKRRKGTKDNMTASLWLSAYFICETTNELFALRSSRVSFRRPFTYTVGGSADVIYARALTDDHFQWLNISVLHYLNPRGEWELNYGFAILNGHRREGTVQFTLYILWSVLL